VREAVVSGKTNSALLTDEREAVQKKTFTKITDLYTDLRDGRMLIKLLEVLSGERLVSYDVKKCRALSVGKYF
ncbi:Spectrin beta chain, non-erythrocytic 1, partial [Saguinus oedipus]